MHNGSPTGNKRIVNYVGMEGAMGNGFEEKRRSECPRKQKGSCKIFIVRLLVNQRLVGCGAKERVAADQRTGSDVCMYACMCVCMCVCTMYVKGMSECASLGVISKQRDVRTIRR